MRKRRRIMRSLRITEISGVDRPAQEGARALIMKRDAAADADERDDGPYEIMREHEDGMDRLADLCKRDGETREQSMSRLVAEGHPLMMSMARNRDAAQELAVAKMNPSPGQIGPAQKRGSPDAGMALVERRLDALAKRRADDEGVGYAEAYAGALETPEGRRLYAEYSDAMDAASRRV